MPAGNLPSVSTIRYDKNTQGVNVYFVTVVTPKR